MLNRIILFIVLISAALNLFAAPFKNVPAQIAQPDGTIFKCLITGDEYYHFYHDQNGFVIIKNPGDNWFYYATKDLNGEQIISGYVPGKDNPESSGLQPHAIISKSKITERHNLWAIDTKSSAKGGLFEGTIHNLVVYIRFLDDTDFTKTRGEYDALFNSETNRSLKNYYNEVTYNKLNVVSSHFPVCEPTTNLAYIDSHNRKYFEPYDPSTNTEGYPEDQLYIRRTALLVNAIAHVKTEIEDAFTKEELDINNDGVIDNICFIIRGGNNDWSDLLWSHMGSIGGQGVLINNKLADNYTFQTESQTEAYVLCHEFFHTIGAPDLYHYSYDGLTPAGPWDLMEGGFVHMGAWMKYKYGQQNWISNIPEITQDGMYKLKPLASTDSNCYMVKSRNSDTEFYVLEYRDANGKYEGNIPGSGLLIYRIIPASSGNAGGPPDEVYIYRPNGTTTHDGNIYNAFYSYYADRMEINDNTNPSGFLSDGKSGGLNISEIGEPGNTISFKISFKYTPDPQSLFAQVSGTTSLILNWEPDQNNDSVMIAYSTKSAKIVPANNVDYQAGDVLPNGGTVIYSGINDTTYLHNNLTPGSTYYYKIWSKREGVYSYPLNANATTFCDYTDTIPYIENFKSKALPDCWNVTDNKKSGQKWEFANIGEAEFSSFTASNGFACINSGFYGLNQSQNTDLLSPSFDFSNNTFIYLHFNHCLKVELNRTIARFMYTIDNGKTWNVLNTWTSSTNNTEIYAIDLSGLLAGQPNVKFKWSYQATADRYWCIDDFEILDGFVSIESLKNKTNNYVSPYNNKEITVAASVTKVHPASGNIFVQDHSQLWSGLSIAIADSSDLWSTIHDNDSLIITALIKDTERIPQLTMTDIAVAGVQSQKQDPVEKTLSEIIENPEACKGLYVKISKLKLEGWDDDWIFSDESNVIYIKEDDTDYSFRTGQSYVISGVYYEIDGLSYLVPTDENDISDWNNLDESRTVESLMLFPNPFSDYLYLNLTKEAIICIRDISGKTILRENVSTTESYKLDTRSLLPGVYLVEVLTSDGRDVVKTIKN
jgi:M6 family metalloprotease-like protein